MEMKMERKSKRWFRKKEDGDGKKWEMKVERWSKKWSDGDGKWNGLGEEE